LFLLSDRSCPRKREQVPTIGGKFNQFLKVQIQSFFQYADFREHLVLSRKALAAQGLEQFQSSSWLGAIKIGDQIFW
jgi:hypothetical protein